VLVGFAFLIPADGTVRVADGDRRARFLFTAGDSGDLNGAGGRRTGPGPWFQVHGIDRDGRLRLIESVSSPWLPDGAAQEILTGPRGTYLIVSSRLTPCESIIHRFRVTGSGRVYGVAPVPGGAVPGMVAGVAMSPDGNRIAYSTLPCAPPSPVRGLPPRAQPSQDPQQSPVLTVLDAGTGQRRGWATPPAAVLGSIVWAGDSRTLGYTLGRIADPPARSPDRRGAAAPSRQAGAVGVAVHALDTAAPGADVRAGRVLLDRSAYAGILTSATVGLDGRGGYGTLRQSSPPSTVMFSFTQGRPIHVIETIEDKPATSVAIGISWDGAQPRYACRTGIDAFGRAFGESFSLDASGSFRCSTATDVPY
jgi:hypothetical protein